MKNWQKVSLTNLSEKIDGILYVEKWKPINGYEKIYKISSFGRVKSLERKFKEKGLGHYYRPALIKKQNFDSLKKYLCIILCKDRKITTYSVHRLVAEHFIKNNNNKKCVNHKNGIKDDNRAINLEWVTHSENMYHAFEKGLLMNDKGGKSKCSKKVAQLDEFGKTIKIHDSVAEAASAVGLKSQSQISDVCNGKKYNKTAAGYKWKYI